MDPDLWIRRPALALASLAPILLGGAWMAVARELPLLRGRPGLAGGLTWALTRALPAALLWGVAGFASLDLRATLLPQAHAALAGGVPYRDYASAFSPLFAPLLAAATLVAGRLGPPLLFLAADLAAWRALAAGEGEAGEAAWAYVAMPVVWYPLIRYQDGGALGAMFVALAFVAMRRGRAAAAGLALAGGLLFTRPLFLLPALACLLGAPAGRRRMAAWAAAPVALVGAVLLARGAPVLRPLAAALGGLGTGPTLWHLPAVLAGWAPGPAGWLPFALLAGAGAAWPAARRAGAAAQAAWQFAAFAALGGGLGPGGAALWAPLLAAWSAGDPDRRGWLLLEATLLPLAPALDSGPLQGRFGAGWQAAAAVALAATALLGLWPVRDALRRPKAPARAAGA